MSDGAKRFDWRRALAGLAFVLILIGAFEPHYVRSLFADRSGAAAFLRELPYRKLPGYRDLMTKAAEITPAGSHVAFWMSPPRWDGGYEYGFYRSGYILAGRQVVPLIDEQDVFHQDRLAISDWIVCWRCEVPFPGYETVWRGPAGSVAKRS